ncbi:DUF805 domain-containing protein [Methylacidiphilum caldifontis]|uniref:DUF805 domain-containing protein n=1 Tax=Methylacidiphilum caldifontis TaxID=2795386 RepID=UPI001A8EE990|nr:DUF805 domain-containing protein [Methylacidiphilum caldifontis]QSR89297.1 DUF805 domain-containing protein [Methylacidiphilum caldifontis]
MEWYLSALRKYADFSGRARRREFWYFFLFNTLFFVGFRILDEFIITEHPEIWNLSHPDRIYGLPGLLFLISGPLSGIYLLVTIVPTLAVIVRRLHDISRSGWLWLVLIINLPLGFPVLLPFFLRDSTPGENRYGPNPKEVYSLD